MFWQAWPGHFFPALAAVIISTPLVSQQRRMSIFCRPIDLRVIFYGSFDVCCCLLTLDIRHELAVIKRQGCDLRQRPSALLAQLTVFLFAEAF